MLLLQKITAGFTFQKTETTNARNYEGSIQNSKLEMVNNLK